MNAMSKKPSQIAVDFPGDKPWFIRRPRVFRYLPAEYANAFFRDGSLRLSSFTEFARHKDEQRQDSEEGKGLIVRRDFAGGHTLVAAAGFDERSYILCGSINLDSSLSAAFGTDSGFVIDDTLGFCAAVSACLPGFKLGLEGLCTYSDRRLVIRDKEPLSHSFEQLKVMSSAELSEMSLKLAGDDLFFVKLARYANQSEYRLIWTIDRPVDRPIVIACPEARKFCTRFEDYVA